MVRCVAFDGFCFAFSMDSVNAFNWDISFDFYWLIGEAGRAVVGHDPLSNSTGLLLPTNYVNNADLHSSECVYWELNFT